MSDIERVYDKVEGSWITLPFVRNNGRLQALPSIVALGFVFFCLMFLVHFLIEAFGADLERRIKAAIFAASYVLGGFALLIAVMVRSAKRQNFKVRQ